MKDEQGREMTTWGGKLPAGESESVASACSGEDAREADQAQLEAAMKHLGVKDVIEINAMMSKAAVSPRSSDGLLPCPFCVGDAFANLDARGNTNWVECRECGAQGSYVENYQSYRAEESYAEARDLWNRRASGSVAEQH